MSRPRSPSRRDLLSLVAVGLGSTVPGCQSLSPAVDWPPEATAETTPHASSTSETTAHQSSTAATTTPPASVTTTDRSQRCVKPPGSYTYLELSAVSDRYVERWRESLDIAALGTFTSAQRDDIEEAIDRNCRFPTDAFSTDPAADIVRVEDTYYWLTVGRVDITVEE